MALVAETRLLCISRELHVMSTAKLQRSEVDLELLDEFFAIPIIGLEELVVFVALHIPVRKQRRRKVNPLTIIALRDHIDLIPDLLCVNFFRSFRVRNIEQMSGPIHEGIYPQVLGVSRNRNVDRQRYLARVANVRHRLRLPLTTTILLDKNDF